MKRFLLPSIATFFVLFMFISEAFSALDHGGNPSPTGYTNNDRRSQSYTEYVDGDQDSDNSNPPRLGKPPLPNEWIIGSDDDGQSSQDDNNDNQWGFNGPFGEIGGAGPHWEFIRRLFPLPRRGGNGGNRGNNANFLPSRRFWESPFRVRLRPNLNLLGFATNRGRPQHGPFLTRTKSAPVQLDRKYGNVDMLLGSLFFVTSDFYLPGRNGIDIEVSRIYTSCVRSSGYDTTGYGTAIPGDSIAPWYLGEGWWWFMGKISPDSIIYYGNGGCEKLMKDIAVSSQLKNCSFEIVRIHDDVDTLFRQDGSRVIYGNEFSGSPHHFRGKYITKIEDASGENYINVTYNDSVPLILTISDGVGRTIWFDYSFTNTESLFVTRLKHLIYTNNHGVKDTIFYKYDNDISDLYSTNPLVMVLYPNNDTIRYAYTDSAVYDDTNYSCDSYRLSEITLPNGGKINYDWGFFYEYRYMHPSAYANRCYWHVNVSSIRKTYLDNSVDTFAFNYLYDQEDNDYFLYESHIKYPDNSAVYYFHTAIKPCGINDTQTSGLLKAKVYFDELPESLYTENFTYAFIAGKDSTEYFDWQGKGYRSYTIGTDLLSDSGYAAPFLIDYIDCYNANIDNIDPYGLCTNPFKTAYNKADFDSISGTFKTNVSELDTVYTYRTHTTSGANVNKTVIDSVIVVDKATSDKIKTVHQWNIGIMKDTLIFSIAEGDTQTTLCEYSEDYFYELAKMIYPLNDSLIYEYDSLYVQPIKARNQYFTLYEASYDSNMGLLEYKINTNGDTTYYSYDGYNRLNRVIYPLETDTSLMIYYDQGNRTIIDSLKLSSGKYLIRTKHLDGFGRLDTTKTFDSDNDTIITVRELDWNNRISRITRPYSSISDTAWAKYDHNVLNQITQITYPDDNFVTFEDSIADNYLLKIKTDQLGRTKIKVYDEAMRITETWSDSSYLDTLSYEYSSFKKVSSITDPRGLETEFSYDGFGNVVSDSSSDQGKYDYFYDSRNRLRFIINSEDDILYRKYDNIGRLLETGEFSGADSVLEDSVDNVSFPTSDTTIWATYRYDSYSDFTPNNSNPLGQLTEVDDRSGKIWLVHDERGRVSRKMIELDGLSDTLDIYYTYGAGNQLTQITYPDSSQITYDYFNSGRVKKIPGYFDVNGQIGVPGFEYEPWGGISKMIHRDTSFTTIYTYNDLSLPTKIFCRDHAFKKWGRDYSYNDARMIETVRDLNNSGNPTTDTLRTFDYDYVYRLKEAFVDADTSKTYTYKYDQSGNRDTLDIETGENHAILEYNLHYDSLLTYFEDTVSVNCYESGISDSAFFFPANTTDTVYWDCTFSSTHHFSYFKVQSLDSTYVDVNSSSSGSFIPVSTERIDVLAYCFCLGECSVVGEVRYTKVDTTETEYLYTNKLSHLSGQSPGNYEWDDKGCLIEDNANNIEYYFDEANHLDSVIIDDIKRYEFKYDAGGRRVKKIFYTGIACDSIETCETGSNDKCEHDTSTCMFVPGDVNEDDTCDYDDVEFLEEFLFGPGATQPSPLFRADVNCDGNINGKDVTYLHNYLRYMGYPAPKCCYWLCSDTLVTYYIYSGNQVIAEYDEDGDLIDNYLYLGKLRLAKFKTGNTFKHYYINDIRGSVATILTSSAGTVASLDYYPFGDVLSQTGDSHLKYTGKELDGGYDFDLYYYGARYYNSGWGRFISPDPVREYYNPYSYVRNNPIYYVDPDGKHPIVWLVIAFLLDAGIEMATGKDISDWIIEGCNAAGDAFGDYFGSGGGDYPNPPPGYSGGPQP